MENHGKPYKMDDLGVPLFLETAILTLTLIFFFAIKSKGEWLVNGGVDKST